jgi:hypothetical protein
MTFVFFPAHVTNSVYGGSVGTCIQRVGEVGYARDTIHKGAVLVCDEWSSDGRCMAVHREGGADTARLRHGSCFRRLCAAIKVVSGLRVTWMEMEMVVCFEHSTRAPPDDRLTRQCQGP